MSLRERLDALLQDHQRFLKGDWGTRDPEAIMQELIDRANRITGSAVVLETMAQHDEEAAALMKVAIFDQIRKQMRGAIHYITENPNRPLSAKLARGVLLCAEKYPVSLSSADSKHRSDQEMRRVMVDVIQRNEIASFDRRLARWYSGESDEPYRFNAFDQFENDLRKAGLGFHHLSAHNGGGDVRSDALGFYLAAQGIAAKHDADRIANQTLDLTEDAHLVRGNIEARLREPEAYGVGTTSYQPIAEFDQSESDAAIKQRLDSNTQLTQHNMNVARFAALTQQPDRRSNQAKALVDQLNVSVDRQDQKLASLDPTGTVPTKIIARILGRHKPREDSTVRR